MQLDGITRRSAAYWRDDTHDFYISRENREKWRIQLMFIAFCQFSHRKDVSAGHFYKFQTISEELPKQYWKIKMDRVVKCIKISDKFIPLQQKIKEWYYAPTNIYANTVISNCKRTKFS